MIEWLNSLGAREFYLFEIRQDVELDTVDGVIFKPAIEEDIQTVTLEKRKILAKKSLRITARGENLIKEDIAVLHEIKLSESVRVWLTNDGLETIGVIVREGLITAIDTGDASGSYAVILEFPENYDFFELKKY